MNIREIARLAGVSPATVSRVFSRNPGVNKDIAQRIMQIAAENNYAPKYTGLGVINPLAAINAASLMLEYLGEKEAADAIQKSIMFVTGNKLKSMSAGKMGYSTSEVGDLVAANL